LAAHRDFRPEEIGEIDKVFSYVNYIEFHMLPLELNRSRTRW
jgi:hypothetical protein